MEFTRTANAGILLKLDGVSILLDGVCREIKPYPATPPEIKASLSENAPDLIAFTHAHKDHYDPGFAAQMLGKNRVIIGVSDCHGTMEAATVGNVTITPLQSRHIGAAGRDTQHSSFWIKGSKAILFTGDASPTQWKNILPEKPDILFVPYAYCITPVAWAAACALGAEKIVLLHMPEREEDTAGLWNAVEETTGMPQNLYLPEMGEKIHWD